MQDVVVIVNNQELAFLENLPFLMEVFISLTNSALAAFTLSGRWKIAKNEIWFRK